jgi:hypothetical protein
MNHVVIDGVAYVPATTTRASIGVAITTRNRADVYARTLAAWQQHLPEGARIFIIDDASDIPVTGADHRFSTRVGIARAKNKCLELMHNAGIEHMFLTDDDTYPLTSNWWAPYVESPEPHLMHVFPDRNGPGVIAHDTRHVAYTDPRGCLLYAHRSVLARVGGMAPIFGQWGHEHVDWSRRIHNAGLTTWRFADITGSGDLIHCLDANKEVERTVPLKERQQAMARNTPILNARTGCADYVEYREQRDVVLTCWLRARDPQRKGRIDQTPLESIIAPLAGSVKDADLHVITDDNTDDLDLNIYLARWVHYWQYLRDHPEIKFAFCVDAGDVTMQLAPWQHMTPGVLYVGYEPKLVSDDWMTTHHKAASLASFMVEQGHRQLLNAGVLGADRATLMAFIHDLIKAIEDNAAARHDKTEPHDLGIGDMAVFNQVAWTRWADRLEWGSQVVTVFKANESNTFSFFQHK